MHEKLLPAVGRHADDLLVFLLDIVATVSSRQWLPYVLCFLKAYGEADVIAALKKQLALPGGLAWIWWEVRTSFTKPSRVKRRLASLRCAIGNLELYQAATQQARYKWRPSTICQESLPLRVRSVRMIASALMSALRMADRAAEREGV